MRTLAVLLIASRLVPGKATPACLAAGAVDDCLSGRRAPDRVCDSAPHIETATLGVARWSRFTRRISSFILARVRHRQVPVRRPCRCA